MTRLLPLVLLAAASLCEAQITVNAPLGGWKHSGGEPPQHMQDVHYPASRVNAGGERYSDEGRNLDAAIRGRIAQAGASKKPHLLVVNGVPMPLSTSPDGRFARPFAFPPGANSVEVRSADRKQVRRVNFYDNNEARQKIGLRVVLSWDTDMTDLDLHVVSPDGQHVYFGDRVAKNGGALDVDVTGGYGPEIYAIPSPPRGLYQVYVNYYGGMGYYDPESGGEGNGGASREHSEITVAQVAIITHEGTPDEKRQVFRIPLRRPGELTLVKSFVFP